MDPCHLLTVEIEVRDLLASRTMGLLGERRGGMLVPAVEGVKLAGLEALPVEAFVEAPPELLGADSDDW
jgi:hypothetical protein